MRYTLISAAIVCTLLAPAMLSRHGPNSSQNHYTMSIDDLQHQAVAASLAETPFAAP
jgi:hypothetical protein